MNLEELRQQIQTTSTETVKRRQPPYNRDASWGKDKGRVVIVETCQGIVEYKVLYSDGRLGAVEDC